ncbi:MAG TPA: hypothetical protein VGC21_23100, partial [Telluria sp.]
MDDPALPHAPRFRRLQTSFIYLAGISLPVLAMAVHAGLGVFRHSNLDPAPTLLHYLLIGSVPLANLLLMLAVIGGQ